jgi:2,4-dienoyl-CoA reductase-like NADH-dependent reductase (Old Yellow Enzyme family)
VAETAKATGFGGVQVHAAHGYLLSNFLSPVVNRRTDQWGGPIENRARLLLEATDAVVSVWGPGRVGVHLAPRADAHSMGDSDLEGTFTYVARELGKRKIAFIATREKPGPDSLGPKLKAAFGGAYIANEGFDGATAQAALDAGWADAVLFGKAFIANPDLPERLRTGAPLNPPDFSTFYGTGAEGSVDIPAQAAVENA